MAMAWAHSSLGGAAVLTTVTVWEQVLVMPQQSASQVRVMTFWQRPAFVTVFRILTGTSPQQPLTATG